MTAQIAQLLEPSDGVGPMQWAVPDWTRGFMYTAGINGMRKYNIGLATQSPLISVKPWSPITVAVLGVDAVSGDPLVQLGSANGDPVRKFDKNTLTQISSFGATTSFPSYPNAVWVGQAVATVWCGTADGHQVGYAFLKESAFSANTAGFRTDDMTACGFYSSTAAGATDGRGTIVAGRSGQTGASVFASYNATTLPTSTIPLYRIDIKPGAESYHISAWPTPNSFITKVLVGNIAASSVDPTWTTMGMISLGYDSIDGNVLMEVYTFNPVTNVRYLIKVNEITGAVMWAVPLLPNNASEYAQLGNTLTARTTIATGGHGETQLIDSVSGTPINAALPGISFSSFYGGLDGSDGMFSASDIAGLFFVRCAYNGAALGAPVPVDGGTPNSFTGFAFIGGIIPVPAPPQPPLPFIFLSCENGWTISTPTLQVYGLDHLIGMTVVGLLDGVPMAPTVVANDGSITLPFPASDVKIGLPFTAQLQLPRLDAGTPSIQGRRKNVSAITLRIDSSNSVQIGTNQTDGSTLSPQAVAPPWVNMTPIPIQTNPSSDPQPQTYTSVAGQTVYFLQTGDIRQTVLASWAKPGQVAIQQVNPLPLTVLAAIPELLEGDTTEQGFSQDQKPQQHPDHRRQHQGPGAWMLRK